jgi:hypothetical protein
MDNQYGYPRQQSDIFWDTENQISMATPTMMNAVPEMEQISFCSTYPSYSQSMGSSNPSLSRPIFGMQEPQMVHEDDLTWGRPIDSPQQTIAPSAAFQQPLMTSSPSKNEPTTPVRGRMQSTMLESSPLSLVSPMVLPSQNELEDSKIEDAEYAILSSELNRRRGLDRISRRSYSKRLGLPCKPKPVVKSTGIDCEVIIPLNEFACSYPGCIDKQTGKQKRFKRQEHKKRHEKTVHEKNDHCLYKCWVPTCKTAPFTRTDNLKSHLRNTHGRNSPNQRNDYVATQDKNSEHFDPEWVGELEEDGSRRWYPKSSKSTFKCWAHGCKAAPFTRADNLKAHMKSAHGKEASMRREHYVDDDDFGI